jgi:integrase/recombinase XerD
MLQEAINEYIISLTVHDGKHGSRKRNTIMAYRNDLRQCHKYMERWGVREWSQVTRAHIEAFLLEMQERQNYRSTTIARKYAALKSFFHYMQQTQGVDSDPLKNIEPPHLERELPQTLSIDQVHRLFQQVEADTVSGRRDRAMLQIVYATGMRASELIALNVEDFNSERAALCCPIRRSQGEQVRVLPLPEDVVEVLVCYLEHARPLLAKDTDERALFLNYRGVRLTRQGFWLIIKGYARQADMSGLTPHMLRHSFAIHMLRKGMELQSVQELLGHAHKSTTQVYHQLAHAHASPGQE